MTRLVDGLVSIDLQSNTENGQEILTLVFQGQPHANVSVSFYEMSKSGPHLVLGIPLIALNNNGEYKFQLTHRWDDGLYIAHIIPALNPPRITQLVDPLSVDPNNTKAFQLGAAEDSLEEAVRLALTAQNAFRNREIRAGGFTGDNHFKVHVIVERCYLDYRQVFEGGVLLPMAHRLGPESILAAVDSLQSGVSFTGNQSLAEGYAYDHPLCLVSFINVQATDHSEAVGAIQTRLDRVLSALAENRSASPEPLAYLTQNAREGLMLSIVSNVYQGNLIPGFGPGVTGLLDLFETGAQSDPWIDFALRLMRSVRTQTNQEAQLFLAWALIEAAAKRNIPSNNQIIVLDDDGEPIMTSRGKLDQSRDLGRVIAYLRDHVGQNMLVNFGPTGTFYEQVRLIYDCRNRIAHEGGISGSANPAPTGYTPLLISMVIDWAAQVLRYECRKAVGIM